jgi:hypothetical protein
MDLENSRACLPFALLLMSVNVPMAKITYTTKKRPVEQYEHKGKQRANNPPVGL